MKHGRSNSNSGSPDYSQVLSTQLFNRIPYLFFESHLRIPRCGPELLARDSPQMTCKSTQVNGEAPCETRGSHLSI